jgi:hypothetical protein
MVFRQHLQFVEFLPDFLIEASNGDKYLREEFIFKLTKKGTKRYTGRRGFIA